MLFRSNELRALLPLVSKERQERIGRFRFERDAQNCLLAALLVRMEICRITNIPNNQLKFSYSDQGKPLLSNDPSLFFNISHAGHYVVCALSDKPVGIDVEMIIPIDLRIAGRLFSSDENEYITKTTDKQLERFFEVWTMKESRIKWEGLGMSKPLQSFSVLGQD